MQLREKTEQRNNRQKKKHHIRKEKKWIYSNKWKPQEKNNMYRNK